MINHNVIGCQAEAKKSRKRARELLIDEKSRLSSIELDAQQAEVISFGVVTYVLFSVIF